MHGQLNVFAWTQTEKGKLVRFFFCFVLFFTESGKLIYTWFFPEFHQYLRIGKWINSLNIWILSLSCRLVFLLVFKMFENIPDENDRLKRKACWLKALCLKA